MQAISPLAASDFLARGQSMRYKFEIYVGSSWVDLGALGSKNYLKRVGCTPSGPQVTADVLVGQWNAEIYNPDGIFSPLHPTSAYKDYFRVGRQVRISFGFVRSGTAYYYQRMIGYMDTPTFEGRTVRLSGCDYGKRLADYTLKESTATSGTINGPLHWGAVEVFDSISSTGVTGSEIYAENDAATIGAGEVDQVGAWNGSLEAYSIADAGGGSTYALQFQRLATSSTVDYAHNSDVGSVVVGEQYYLSLGVKVVAGTDWTLRICQTVGGTLKTIGTIGLGSSPTWGTYDTVFTAIKTGALELRVSQAKGSASDEIRIDQITIKSYEITWYRYEMPTGCEGPYYVTLDGEQIVMGSRDKAGHFDGYLYDEDNLYFYFDEDRVVENGDDNLLVYYYIAQAPENMVADILVHAGYYADRATALAAMDYTATGITILRPWFDKRTKGSEAVRKICERVNYRFWFDYAGTPCFKPAPAVGTSVFDFTSYGHIKVPTLAQRLEQIKNFITITGSDEQPFAQTDELKDSKYEGQASDATSIAAYGEHTESIENHLYQDAASITTAVAAMLAERKDPKWYIDLPVPFMPVPLEPGDTITARINLYAPPVLSGGSFTGGTGSDTVDGGDFGDAPSDAVDGGTLAGGGVSAIVTGIIRSVSLDMAAATYTVEISSWS